MAKIEFTVKLEYMGGRGPSGNLGNWTKVVMPASASAKLGSKARVPVSGTINGFAFRASAMPTGQGDHFIQVNAGMREGAGIAAGDRVRVVVEVDTKPRPVAIPLALRRALAASGKAKAAFAKLAPSHRKAIAIYIAEAKQAGTIERRTAKTIAELENGTWRPR
jgi:hypothetical protein